MSRFAKLSMSGPGSPTGARLLQPTAGGGEDDTDESSVSPMESREVPEATANGDPRQPTRRQEPASRRESATGKGDLTSPVSATSGAGAGAEDTERFGSKEGLTRTKTRFAFLHAKARQTDTTVGKVGTIATLPDSPDRDRSTGTALTVMPDGSGEGGGGAGGAARSQSPPLIGRVEPPKLFGDSADASEATATGMGMGLGLGLGLGLGVAGQSASWTGPSTSAAGDGSSRQAGAEDEEGEQSAEDTDDSLSSIQGLAVQKSMTIKRTATERKPKWFRKQGRTRGGHRGACERICCVISARSRWKRVWDILIMVMLLYSVVMMPLRMCFGGYALWSLVMDLIVDGLFIIDIAFCFVSSYELPNGLVVRDVRSISKNYLTSWFPVDLAATFPAYLLGESQGQSIMVANAPRIFRLIRVLRLLKLLRAYRFRALLENLEYSPSVHPGVVRVLRFGIAALSFTHFSACLWIFLGDPENPDSWLVRAWPNDPIADRPYSSQYIASFYFTLTTLATIGFGDITPRTTPEILWTIAMMVTGTTFFAYTTATVTSIIASFDVKDSNFRSRMHSLVNFMKGVGLGKQLQDRLIRHMRFVWLQPHTWDWRSLLKDAPETLRYEVCLDMHKDLINDSIWFQRLRAYPEFTALIAQELKPVEFVPGHMIVRRGQPVENWYIVASGVVEAVSNSNKHVYLRLERGMSFGDVGMFLPEHTVWETNLRCTTRCRLFLIDKATMLGVVDLFERTPRCDENFYNVLETVANERLHELKLARQAVKQEIRVNQLSRQVNGDSVPTDALTGSQHLSRLASLPGRVPTSDTTITVSDASAAGPPTLDRTPSVPFAGDDDERDRLRLQSKQQAVIEKLAQTKAALRTMQAIRRGSSVSVDPEFLDQIRTTTPSLHRISSIPTIPGVSRPDSVPSTAAMAGTTVPPQQPLASEAHGTPQTTAPGAPTSASASSPSARPPLRIVIPDSEEAPHPQPSPSYASSASASAQPHTPADAPTPTAHQQSGGPAPAPAAETATVTVTAAAAATATEQAPAAAASTAMATPIALAPISKSRAPSPPPMTAAASSAVVTLQAPPLPGLRRPSSFLGPTPLMSPGFARRASLAPALAANTLILPDHRRVPSTALPLRGGMAPPLSPSAETIPAELLEEVFRDIDTLLNLVVRGSTPSTGERGSRTPPRPLPSMSVPPTLTGPPSLSIAMSTL